MPLIQLMQADPHKLDFRSDLLARFPGAGGLGQLGPLAPSHDLTRPPSLFSAAGACLEHFRLPRTAGKMSFLSLCAQIVAINNVQCDKQNSGSLKHFTSFFALAEFLL